MTEIADPQGPAAREDAEELDLRAYARILLRRRWTVLAVLAAAVLGTLLFTLRQTPIYAATATLIIDLAAPKVLGSKDVQEVVETGSSGFWSSKEYFETQYKVITSRAVAQRVIEKLGLARDLRFLGLDEVKDEAARQQRLEKLDPVTVLQERLKVLPVKDSRVVRVQVEDRDPRWAATLANAVADAYIAESLSVRATTTQSASDWLEQQLADLEGKLAQSSDELFRFKQAHDIVSTSWEDRQSIVSQRLVTINDALTRQRIQKAQVQARNEAMRGAIEALAADPEADATLLSRQNSAVEQLKVRYLDAKVECADARARYLDDHPKVEACQAKVDAARANFERELRSTLAAADGEQVEAAQAERKLERLLAETKTDAFGLNQHEKEYLELKRKHDNNQRLYELVLQRLKETGVTGMLQMSNVRVLDRAEPPVEPATPRPVRNLALALVLGLAAGLALALLVESLDTTITSREQVEERLGAPFLGVVPRIPRPTQGAPELAVVSAPHSAVAECLRSIRTNLLFMSPEKPLRTILVTSSGPSEGKTTNAISLAATMAGGGHRVLLVDADMRRPRVHKVFGLQPRLGLSSLILGEGTPEQAIVATGVPDVELLPCGQIPPNPAELLHTAGFRNLLAELARRYDRVVIDSPPAGVVADAVVIATHVDGTLLVLKAGQTSRAAAERTTRSLHDVKARLFGVVLNDVDLEDRRYGEYHAYYGSAYDRGDGAKEPSAA